MQHHVTKTPKLRGFYLILVFGLCMLFVFSTQAKVTAREFSLEVGQLSTPKDWAEWRLKVSSLHEKAKDFVNEKKSEFLIGKINQKERDVMLISLIWPKLLSPKVPFAKQYYECASLHASFLSQPTQSILNDWKNCVDMGYGRDSAPEIYTLLVKWYQALLPSR